MDQQVKPRQSRVQRRKRQRRKRRIFVVLLLLCLAGVILWARAGRGSHSDETVRSGAISQLRSLLHLKQPTTLLEEDWVEQDLLPVNPYSRPGTELDEVNGIVVHYVGNPATTARQNRNYFADLAEEGGTYASSHFIIGLEGEVIQCIPLDEIAYCSNDRNSDTISIECCHPGEDGAFTDATYRSLIRLLRTLCDEYDLGEEDLIRHYDVTGKDCPKYYVDNPDAWEQLKSDVFDPNFSVDESD